MHPDPTTRRPTSSTTAGISATAASTSTAERCRASPRCSIRRGRQQVRVKVTDSRRRHRDRERFGRCSPGAASREDRRDDRRRSLRDRFSKRPAACGLARIRGGRPDLRRRHLRARLGHAAVPVATTIPWKLASAVSARKPRTVYLRFPTSSEPAETFGTGIVLDTTKPTIARATLSGRTGRSFKVRLRAKEAISGISQVRFSTRPGGGTAITLASRKTRGILDLSRTISVQLRSAPKWVRARSAAGTWSKWHRVG